MQNKEEGVRAIQNMSLYYQEWMNTQKVKTIKHRLTVWSSNSTAGCTPKRSESKDSSKYLYTHVHSSISHNSQNVCHRWMDKQRVVYI